MRAGAGLLALGLASIVACAHDADQARPGAGAEASTPRASAAQGSFARIFLPEPPFELVAYAIGSTPAWIGDDTPSLRLGPEGITFRTARGLERLPLDGGHAKLLIEDMHVDAFERDDENLYWIRFSGEDSWDLMRSDLAGQAVAMLGHGRGVAPVPLAIDEDHVYVGGPCAANTIYSVPIKGRGMTTLSAPCDAESLEETERYEQLSALRGALAWIVPTSRGPCLFLLRPESSSAETSSCLPFDGVTASRAAFYSARGVDFDNAARAGRIFRWKETRAESAEPLFVGWLSLYVHQLVVDGDDVYLFGLHDEPTAGEIWHLDVPSHCFALVSRAPLGTRIAARDGQLYALLSTGDLYRRPRAPLGKCRR